MPASSNTLTPGDIVYSTPGFYEVTLEVTNECGVSSKATQSFEVFEIPEITNVDLTQEICSNQSTSEIALTANNPSTNYSWSATASANITGFIPNGTSNTIPVQTIINNGNTAETVKFIVTPRLGICDGDSKEFIITVNPSPEITTHPNSSVVCLNGAATLLEVAYKNGSGAATYQWYQSVTDDITKGSEIAGATDKTYQPTTNVDGVIYYYVKISFTSGGCSEIFSKTASVIVNKQLTITSAATNQEFCLGGSADELEATHGDGVGNTSYQWFSNTANSNSGGSSIGGATNSTYTPTDLSSIGAYYYYVEVSKDGIGCTSATSNVYEIDVIADPVIDTQALAAQELCQSAAP